MDKELMLNEIKSHYGFKKDSEFARYLGVKPQVVSNWKARNTLDLKLIYTKCLDISPEWLITGEGEMLKSEKKYDIENHPIAISSEYRGANDIDWKERYNLLLEEYNTTLKKFNALLEDKSKHRAS